MILPQHDFPNWVRDSLDRRGRAVIRGQGPSMLPSIPDGALLEVQPVAFDELKAGDLVVYHRSNEVFCHRLIRKSGRECVLKGDALLAADPPVGWPQVLGRVAVVIAEGDRSIPLDHPDERRRAMWRARMSYPRALWQRVCAAIPRIIRRELRP